MELCSEVTPSTYSIVLNPTEGLLGWEWGSVPHPPNLDQPKRMWRNKDAFSKNEDIRCQRKQWQGTRRVRKNFEV